MDLSTSKNIVVIGAGQAGAQAVMSLRLFGYEGAITLVGDETALPYQRPPLSKAYMKGELGEERLYFKPAATIRRLLLRPGLGPGLALLRREVRRLDRRELDAEAAAVVLLLDAAGLREIFLAQLGLEAAHHGLELLGRRRMRCRREQEPSQGQEIAPFQRIELLHRPWLQGSSQGNACEKSYHGSVRSTGVRLQMPLRNNT